MSKKVRKIIFIFCVGLIFLIMFVIFQIAFSYRSKKQHQIQYQQETSKIYRPTKYPNNKTFPKDVLPKREDINLQLTLEQRKRRLKLSSAEEKNIIESLSSQIDINKDESFFDYNWGFSMIPGTREIFSDTDEALYLFTDRGKFFVKVNSYSDLSRFEYKKESMIAINEAVSDFTPHPLCLGNLPKGGKFLVVNFIEARWHDRLVIENQKLLAKGLAQLHQRKSHNGKFGFHIGKNNQWKDNWATFFWENRWQPLWKRVLKRYPQNEELKKWGAIVEEEVIPNLLGDLSIEPVLLHGNLDFDSWDINSQTNQPWVFDAHSYYGHNEMDLSLIHYFCPPGKIPNSAGEFSEPEFLAEYQKSSPIQPGFKKRKALYKLYHWLHRNIARNPPVSDSQWLHEKLLNKLKKICQKRNSTKIS